MSFDFGSLPWGDILKTGVSLYGASQGANAAKKAAQSTRPVPYGVSGPAGGFNVDPRTGQINLSMAANPFANMFNALGASGFANAAVAPGSFMYGANPELVAAYQGTFGQGLTDRISSNLDLMRRAAAPEENRQRLGLNDRLYSMGQFGTSGGGEQVRGLSEAQQQADLQRQLAAIGLGRQEANDRFTNAFQTIGQGMTGQQQNFNIGIGAFNGMQGLFQNLINQGQLGVGAAGAVNPAAAMYSANASQSPLQTGYNFLNQSGLFDKLNGLWKPKAAPPTPAPYAPQGPGSFNPAIYY